MKRHNANPTFLTQLISSVQRAALFALLTGLLPGSSAFAEDYPNVVDSGHVDESDDWYRECLRVKDVRVPSEDMPSKQLTASLDKCNAEDLYYDAKGNPQSTQADWNKVRACALANNEYSILMMLYANRLGVNQNRDLAIKYACSAGGFSSEKEPLIEDLMSLKGSEKPIDQCDYAGVTPTIGYCVALSERQKERARNRNLDAMSSRWSAEQKSAFEALRKAKDDFADARGRDETDLSGTGRAVFWIEAESAEKDLFVNDMHQFEGGATPTYTQPQFAALDKQLNQTYRKLMHALAPNKQGQASFSTVSAEGVKTAERIWLKYRDAWVAFGRVRYPAVAAHAWMALLTERRIKQLDELNDTAEPGE